MLTITPGAYARLKQQLTDRPADVAVRMIVGDGRIKFRRGTQRSGDAVFQHEGRPVLLVRQGTANRIANRTLDALETDDGKKLRLRRAK